ncbi:unnamed protein product [Lupinus luteus]|uniref:Uncharacterized protein n=1 Tax=Lupinus luteus TaxID=3873 RepID=A0AAV1WS25_LUPLU
MSAFKNVKSLRTLLEIYSSDSARKKVPSFSSLRALQIIGAYEFSALADLTHLRYLYIYNSDITALPESLCSLMRLQILKLERCSSLDHLPQHLTRLKDLRHLIIKKCKKLVAMSPSIGKLKCLKTLSIFIVDLKSGFGLEELHDLQLGGKLHIRGLENAKTESDARPANLVGKKNLNRLSFSWNVGNDISQGTHAESVLNALQPHCNLKGLKVNGYPGIQFPTWMRNPSLLQGLVKVTFKMCFNCQGLPPLGKLPYLSTLQISDMLELKYIDEDSYDNTSLMAFKSLKKLTLCNLPNLERVLRDEGIEMLSLISKLMIDEVPKFQLPYFSQGTGRHLKFLHVCQLKAKMLPDEFGNLNALKELRINHCPEMESFPEHVLQGLTSLQTLKIVGCHKLSSLSDAVGHISCLEHLDISYCNELTSVPSSISQLTNLKEFVIDSCPQLTLLPISFPELPNLQTLKISNCPGLTSLPSSFSQLIASQKLSISGCPELEKQFNLGTEEDSQPIFCGEGNHTAMDSQKLSISGIVNIYFVAIYHIHIEQGEAYNTTMDPYIDMADRVLFRMEVLIVAQVDSSMVISSVDDLK